MSTQSREALVSEMATVMRLFMAHAVLFQDAVARWAGLNSIDLQCAGLLLLEGPQTPSELARRTGISPGGAITAVVDRLEAAGLVDRARDAADRRRVLVTPKTDVLMQRVGPAYASVTARWNDYLATLEDDEIALVTDALRQATAINREEIDSLRGIGSADRGRPATPDMV